MPVPDESPLSNELKQQLVKVTKNNEGFAIASVIGIIIPIFVIVAALLAPFLIRKNSQLKSHSALAARISNLRKKKSKELKMLANGGTDDALLAKYVLSLYGPIVPFAVLAAFVGIFVLVFILVKVS